MRGRSILLIISLLFSAFSCNTSSKQIKSSKVPEYDTITYKLINVEGGWGYDILVNDKVFIHQPFIPAVQGHFAFRTAEDARRTAILAIKKMVSTGQFPSMKVEELDSIGVLYDTVLKYQDYVREMNNRKR